MWDASVAGLVSCSEDCESHAKAPGILFDLTSGRKSIEFFLSKMGSKFCCAVQFSIASSFLVW